MHDAPAYLHEFLHTAEVPDLVDTGTVDIPEREIFEEVAEGVDIEFFTQQFSFLRANALQVFDRIV